MTYEQLVTRIAELQSELSMLWKWYGDLREKKGDRMTYEELIAGMDKWEAVFRCLTQLRSGCDLSCLKCPYWNEDDGGRWHCIQPSIEKICHADFEEWKKTEVE